MEHPPTRPTWWVTGFLPAGQDWEYLIISGSSTGIKCLIPLSTTHLHSTCGSCWSHGKVQPADSYLGDAWQVEEISEGADPKQALISWFSEVKNENMLQLLMCNFWGLCLTVEHSSPKTLGVCHLRKIQQIAADCGHILPVSIQPSQRALLLAVCCVPQGSRATCKNQTPCWLGVWKLGSGREAEACRSSLTVWPQNLPFTFHTQVQLEDNILLKSSPANSIKLRKNATLFLISRCLYLKTYQYPKM